MLINRAGPTLTMAAVSGSYCQWWKFATIASKSIVDTQPPQANLVNRSSKYH
jgi:hypothetical protein